MLLWSLRRTRFDRQPFELPLWISILKSSRRQPTPSKQVDGLKRHEAERAAAVCDDLLVLRQLAKSTGQIFQWNVDRAECVRLRILRTGGRR